MTGLLNFILKISDRTEIGTFDPHLHSDIFPQYSPPYSSTLMNIIDRILLPLPINKITSEKYKIVLLHTAHLKV